jgi:hypothetical protein
MQVGWIAYGTGWCSHELEVKSNWIWKGQGIDFRGIGRDYHWSCEDSSRKKRDTENCKDSPGGYSTGDVQ